MKALNISLIMLIHFLIICELCNGDTNLEMGFNCPEETESASEETFQTNLRNLLELLVGNLPHKKGFFKTESGKRQETVLYGLVQCRGDISDSDCSSCAKDSIRVALEKCQNSKDVSVWFRWCFLRYSDHSFFGVMDQTSISRTNDTDFDDLSAGTKGLELMNWLAFSAQSHNLMFETGSVDLGSSGKRFGMAQCNRDIRRTDCGKCLQSQLEDFKTTVWNKRGWEVYGLSCFMWYHDFKFYFNNSMATSQGVTRHSTNDGALNRLMILILALMMDWLV